MNLMEKELFEIKESVIKKLANKIVTAEGINLRTKNKTTEQMIKEIKSWIEEEVDCLNNK